MRRRKPRQPPPELPKDGIRRHLPVGPQVAGTDLVAELSRRALGLGFCRVGFTPVEPWADAEARLQAWLDAGHAGELDYMREGERADARSLLASAKTLIAVALAYPNADEALADGQTGPALTGSVARYARGQDYHRVLKDKLLALADELAELTGRPVIARACVDTAPLLEREAAARAGLGFVSKSTLLLIPGIGTNVLLGELLVDVELPPATPVKPGCGSCRACLDVCPTGAFVAPHVLDARRCISYLTIEHEGVIPRELRAGIGVRVFGCDACQDACPFNASASPRPNAPELAPRPELLAPDLLTWLGHGSSAHRRLVKRSALRRAKRATLARNAAVALGNLADPIAVPALCRALREDRSAVVRGHAAWALGRIPGADATAALEATERQDPDPEVREEARLALAERHSRQ